MSDITVAHIDAACLEQLQKTFPDITSIRLGTEGCAWPESLENKRSDSVVLINVLEHREDDGQALKNIFRVHATGGTTTGLPRMPSQRHFAAGGALGAGG